MLTARESNAFSFNSVKEMKSNLDVSSLENLVKSLEDRCVVLLSEEKHFNNRGEISQCCDVVINEFFPDADVSEIFPVAQAVKRLGK